MDNLNVSRATWRKSSRSAQNGECVEIAAWRKSSRSNGAGGECVEVADAGNFVAVRDSKAPDAGHLAFDAQQWAAFMTEAQAGRHDL